MSQQTKQASKPASKKGSPLKMIGGFLIAVVVIGTVIFALSQTVFKGGAKSESAIPTVPSGSNGSNPKEAFPGGNANVVQTTDGSGINWKQWKTLAVEHKLTRVDGSVSFLSTQFTGIPSFKAKNLDGALISFVKSQNVDGGVVHLMYLIYPDAKNGFDGYVLFAVKGKVAMCPNREAVKAFSYLLPAERQDSNLLFHC